MKSVTLDGDIYDPAGSLSGGSKAQNSGILLKLRNKKQLMEQVNEKQALLDDIAKTLENYQRQLQKYNKTKQALDLKQHALKLLEEQLSSNSSAKVIRLVQELHEGVSQIDVEIKELEAKKRECIERQKSLEKEMEELSQHRESKLKAIQKELDKCKKEVAKATPFIKTKQQEVDIASEEIRKEDVTDIYPFQPLNKKQNLFSRTI